MTIRLHMKHEGIVRQYAFDRQRVSVGRGPFNDIVLGDNGIATTHGTLVVQDDGTMAFECSESGFPTSIVREGICIQTGGGETPRVFAVRVGDVIRIGTEVPIDIEIHAPESSTATAWEARSMSREDAVRPTAAVAQRLFRLTSQLSRQLTPHVLLRGVATIVRDLTGQAPQQTSLAILPGPGEFHRDVYSFQPDPPREEEAAGGPEERKDDWIEGQTSSLVDPLESFGSVGHEILAALEERDVYGFLKRSRSGGAAFLPVGRDDALWAVIVITFAGPSREALAGELGLIAALIRPLARLLVEGRRREEVSRSYLEENRYFRERERRHYLFKDLICESEAMRAVYDELNERVSADAPVLITGEAGTGKELLARALHHLGPRAEGMLISLNCGLLNDELLDFELFGCVESELIGAVAPRKGIFELAQDGTVFLDEIDLLSPMMQGKLLRVIKEREVRRIGDAVGRRVNARLIASTHRDLEAMARSGALRHDLYLTLRDAVLEVPPLRQRKEDILPLARTFLKKFRERHNRRCHGFGDNLGRWMLTYGWPGNVRELQTFVESAVLKAGDRDLIDRDDLAL